MTSFLREAVDYLALGFGKEDGEEEEGTRQHEEEMRSLGLFLWSGQR